MHRAASVVVAAGKGSRMGTSVKKQYLDLKGVPILIRTLKIFEESDEISETILVVSSEDIKYAQDLVDKYNLKKVFQIIPGGKTRSESVYNGLKKVSGDCDLVAVHDGARPLLSKSTLKKCIDFSKKHNSAVAAVKVKDTIKIVEENNVINKTLPRNKLWAVQTPQIFNRNLLLKCYKMAMAEGVSATDDASILEYYGYEVKVVEGEYDNIKITTPEDIILAERIVGERLE